MRITIDSVGDFKDTVKWLSESSRRTPINALKAIASEGVAALSASTPVGETGETSRGWVSNVITNSTGGEVWFTNLAHPQAAVNVAIILEYGHGTLNGGYVPARPYIRQAMRSVFDTAGDRMIKEMIR